MATTLTLRQTDKARELIKVEKICLALSNHVEGITDMKSTQINAARILLDKSMPSLMAQAFSVDDVQALIPILKIVPHESDKAA